MASLPNKNKYPFISIVIPIYNAKQFIVGAIESVLKTNYPYFEIIIIDDLSTDGSFEQIKQKFIKNKKITFVQNKQKKLAAGSRNEGIKRAKGELIALLDHDIEVDKNWLKEIVATFQVYPEVSVVQSRVLDLSKKDVIQHAGIKINTYLGWVVARGFGLSAKKHFLASDEVFANATGLVFKKKVWKAVGGFDEDLAINTDDWDFNWKCWMLGFRQRLSPKAITYHWSKKQQTRDVWIKRTQWEFHFAKVHYIFIKNYEFKNILIFLPVYLAVNFGRGVFNLIFRLNSAPIIASVTSLGWLILHFPKLLEKRRLLSAKRKISDKYLIDHLMDHNFVPNYFIKHWFQAFRVGKSISTESPY